MKHIWRAGGVGFLLTVFIVAAAREYTFYGALAVFLLLLVSSLPLLFVTRFTLSVSLIIGFLLILIDYVDGVKFEEVRQHLNHQDAATALTFIRELNFGFFQQYVGVALPVFFAGALFLIVVACVARVEFTASGGALLTPVSALLAVTAAVLAFSFFMKSDYMTAVRSQFPSRVAADRAPLRLSATLASISEGLLLAKTLEADRASHPPAGPDQPPALCDDCPDIVIVHLESVYDPRFEASYAHMPPFADLVGGDLEKWSTLAKVNTWGGNSVVTEFELLCSVNHELFGWGGFQPHINVAPFIDGCFGAELKARGYDNNVLYSLNGSFSNVHEAFSRYGIANFQDFRSLGLPTRWHDLHDRLIYDHFFKAMDEPRRSPRFFWISTNWNHGPHGLGGVTEKFEGPYDPARANSPALADYVNRLNDSIAALREIEEYARAATYPIVVLAYGDHHPAFAKDYSQETLDSFDAPDYLTPMVMMRNFTAERLPPKPTITVEEVTLYLSRFAGIAPLQSIEKIHEIQVRCGGDQRNCSEEDKSALRAIHLK